MKKKVTHPEVLNEIEFSKSADELLEVIRMYYLHRDGVNLTHEERVAIALEVLESRG